MDNPELMEKRKRWHWIFWIFYAIVANGVIDPQDFVEDQGA